MSELHTASPTSVVAPWLSSIPKVNLHCHLEGTVDRRLLGLLAEEAGEALPADAIAQERITTFTEFLARFRDICRHLATPQAFALIARAWCEGAVRERIRYAELFVAPAAWLRLHPSIDVRAVFEVLAVTFAEYRQAVEVHLLVDITRNFGVEQAEKTLDIALAMRDCGVIGLGLGGDEIDYPAALFVETYARARRADLRLVAHAGETAGAARVAEAYDLLGAERIGHGIGIAEDPRLMQRLAAAGCVLEQAPTSNEVTGVVPDFADHPMGRCVEAGLRVVIGDDDPGIFDTTLTHELMRVSQRFGEAFLRDRLFDAVEASFAPAWRRAELRSELLTALAQR